MNCDSHLSGWILAIRPLDATVDALAAMSPGRGLALIALVSALIGVGGGGLALWQRGGRAAADGLRRRALVALIAGLIGVALGCVVARAAPTGVGTGNGLGGALIAMTLGLAGMVAGALALVRLRGARPKSRSQQGNPS